MTISVSTFVLPFDDDRGDAPNAVVDDCKGGGGGILRTLALNLLPLANATIYLKNYA